jgi:hypothetical protein
MNLNDDVVLRRVRLGPFRQRHPGRSRGLVCYHNRLHPAPPCIEFPNLNAGGETLKTNRIMPEPTAFIDRKFPNCSIIRPTETVGAAEGAVKGLAASGLFTGQSQEFFAAATALAKSADAATRK